MQTWVTLAQPGVGEVLLHASTEPSHADLGDDHGVVNEGGSLELQRSPVMQTWVTSVPVRRPGWPTPLQRSPVMQTWVTILTGSLPAP